MSKLVIPGNQRIFGSVGVHGAKNSVLPILAATLNTKGRNFLHNCPELSDVELSAKILRSLGVEVRRCGDEMEIRADSADGTCISPEMMREMRSSILFLGAMLARNGEATLCAPGGCDLGPRPIDLHLMALRKLGAEIEESENGAVYAKVNGRLHGAEIRFPSVSVGATENTLIAAATAEGTTLIRNAACEPEITDLVRYLRKCGAQISGTGTSNLRIEGVPELKACDHRIIPDRIVAATYLSAAAVTGGTIRLEKVDPSHLRPVMKRLEDAGCLFSIAHGMISMAAPERLSAMKRIQTEPYPGFPTDAQALLMAVAATADGVTPFYETIFQNRFRHAAELNKMGADISVDGLHAVVNGVPYLYGTAVRATDLRGGAAMVVAALAAEGETEISDIYHIDRGYERIENVLGNLGVEVLRCKEWNNVKAAAESR